MNAQKNSVIIDSFLGVDLHSSPSNVAFTRSPDAPNMVRDVPGKVRKRMGYHDVGEYPARINGAHFFHTTEGTTALIHAGSCLYREGEITPICQTLADDFSAAYQLGGKLYITDGVKLRSFDGDTVEDAEASAYVPTLTVSRFPSGGGTAYEAINLLTGEFTESFLANGSAAVFQLSLSGLDAAPVHAKRMISNGVWRDYTYGVDFSVNAATGTVTFINAVPASPVDGMDNLTITASKTNDTNRSMINKCRFGVVYGANGASDRLFLSGNPDYPHCDWFSELRDPNYFPENDRSELGTENTAVSGYSIIDNRLATHKTRDDSDRNIIIRTGDFYESVAAFPVSASLCGPGAVSNRAFASVEDEALFLSDKGVYAVTRQDISGERYTQNRSFFINPALCAEQLSDACASVYNDFLIIAAGNKLYLLDTLSRRYEPDAPHSKFQYEAYVCHDIPARIMYLSDGKLRFGTAEGVIMEFYTDADNPVSYNDMGSPISAHWTLPDFLGKSFSARKRISAFAMRLRSASATSVKLSAMIRGCWSDLLVEDGARYLSFSRMSFGRMSFSCDMTPRTLYRRLSLRRLPTVRFKLLNDSLNEPFGIYELGIEYTETER